MKNAIVIALALVSVSAFAAAPKHTKAEKKAAQEACVEHKADKKAFKLCVAEKLAATAVEAKTEAVAPGTEAKTEATHK